MDGLLKKVRSGVHLGRWRFLRVLGRQELPRVCLLGLIKHASQVGKSGLAAASASFTLDQQLMGNLSLYFLTIA